MDRQGSADQTEGKERQVQAVETRMLSWVATTSLGKTGWRSEVVESLVREQVECIELCLQGGMMNKWRACA